MSGLLFLRPRNGFGFRPPSLMREPARVVVSDHRRACYISRVRVAGIDFGQARVGLAVSDDMGVLAHPRPHLDGRDLNGTLRELAQMARCEEWQRVILGLPRNLDGSEGLSARRARRFADLVKQATGLPVELVDEWLSTREARARLSEQGLTAKDQKSRIDSASAAVLLQSWLNRSSTEDER